MIQYYSTQDLIEQLNTPGMLSSYYTSIQQELIKRINK
jgi:hypothetical protein